MPSKDGQAYLQDMLSMSEEKTEEGISEIAEFFHGANVLVTGGSGFLGKILVEKLLRSCSGLSKLYMFMREKKGKTPEERFVEHFEDPLYDRLKKERPDFGKQIVMVHGDTGNRDLGLSKEDREMIKDTHIIFHGAATVRFDEKLRKIVNINIRGTKEMLLYAREMPNLKAFVHISTAFAHCVHKVIEEKFYEPTIDGDQLIQLTELLNDEQLELLTPNLIGKYPNTYAFSKATVEQTVKKYSVGLPTCVIRPAIVISVYDEPLSGWTNNLYGATGVVFGASMGLLRSLHCNEDYIADIIPADIVVNNTVAAAWDIYNTRCHRSIKSVRTDNEVMETVIEEPVIYNVVSSCQNPITWKEFRDYNYAAGREIPSPVVIWYYMFSLIKHRSVHLVRQAVLQFLPALIVDGILVITGRKPLLWKAYKKISKFGNVISYFSTQQWRFHNESVLSLWDKLSETDKKLFYFDIRAVDWGICMMYHMRGCRMYLLKDPIDTLGEGRRKYRRLKYAHYSLLTIVSLLGLWLLYLVLCRVFSFLF